MLGNQKEKSKPGGAGWMRDETSFSPAFLPAEAFSQHVQDRFPEAFRCSPPMLRGTVLPQWVRHTGAGCRCRRGEPHGPYHYLFQWTPGRRLRKRYVRKAEVEEVSALCHQYQAVQALCLANRRRHAEVYHQASRLCRLLERGRKTQGESR